jgi:transposase
VLTLGLTGRIWVCTAPQDGRKCFDGLQSVVTAHLGKDPLSGDLYVFRNRRGDRLKILAWQGDGFALYTRRLERGLRSCCGGRIGRRSDRPLLT